jgi:hypothetical protein
VIGYYVHHQGSGHLHRTLAVAARLAGPVTVLSSLPRPPGCRLPWVELARDDLGTGEGRDVDAGGTLHWVPRGDDGLAVRTGQVVDWVVRERPRAFVVDVSVEVAVLVRLTGTPVVVSAMPGDRSDRAHRTAYDLADRLVAPWPAALGVQRWDPAWEAKTVFAGGISRFDGRLATPRPRPGAAGPRRGLLLWGSGAGDADGRRLDGLLAATPGWDWQVAGVGPRLGTEEVWAALDRADVVVTHAGQNAVAEVSAARAPAVVVADDRPFGEQHATAAALRRGDVAVALDRWPDDAAWPGLLSRAQALGGAGWRQWSTGHGAAAAAAAIEAVAAGPRVPGPRCAVVAR